MNENFRVGVISLAGILGFVLLVLAFLLTIFNGSGADVLTSALALLLFLSGGSLWAVCEWLIRKNEEKKISILSFIIFIANGFSFHLYPLNSKWFSLSVRQDKWLAVYLNFFVLILSVVFVFRNGKRQWKLWSNALASIGFAQSGFIFLYIVLGDLVYPVSKSLNLKVFFH